MERALLDMPIVWPKHAIDVNAKLVKLVKLVKPINHFLMTNYWSSLAALPFAPHLNVLMRLKKYIFMITITALDLTNTTRFIKSSWTLSTDRDPALNTYVDAIKHDILTANRNHITDNLTKDEQALRNLKKRQEILNNQTC